MQGRRISILMAVVLPLAIIACNKDQTQGTPTPAAAPAAKSAAAAAVAEGAAGAKSGSTIAMQVHAHGLSKEVHIQVPPGTNVTWSNSTQFYIQFDPTNNPCEPSTSPSGSYTYYNSIQTSSNPVQYTATCTIASTPIGKAPFFYKIGKGTHLTEPKKKLGLFSGHCQGCGLDQ